MTSLTACSNSAGGLPDGTYKPVAMTMPGMGRMDDSMAMAAYNNYSIIIKGNTFTFKVGGVSESAKYTYKDGTLTVNSSATTELSLDIDYKDDSLFWNIANGLVLELSKDGKPSSGTASNGSTPGSTPSPSDIAGQGDSGADSAYTPSTTDLKLSIIADVKTFGSGISHKNYTRRFLRITSEDVLQEAFDSNYPRNFEWKDIDTDVRSICVFDDYQRSVMYIKNDNSLWGYGSNQNGRLGDGTGVDKDAPVYILDDVVQLYSRGYDSRGYGYFALKTDKTLWTWGDGKNYAPVLYESDIVSYGEQADFGNTFGRGGDILHKASGSLVGVDSGEKNDSIVNAKVREFAGIYSISMGFLSISRYFVGYFIDEDNTLWLSDANKNVEEIAENVSRLYLDEPGKSLLFISLDGSLWGIGENTKGQLGDGTKAPRNNEAVKIADNVKNAKCYGYLTVDGEYWVWDSNDPSPSMLFDNVAEMYDNGILFKDGTYIVDLERWMRANAPEDYVISDVKIPQPVVFE